MRFVVMTPGPRTSETVVATDYRITEGGALIFSGRDRVLVKAFAPGAWALVQKVLADAGGDGG